MMRPRLPGGEEQGGGADCRWVEELLPWYATGTLEASEGREVRRHLRCCPRCRAALAEVERLYGALDGVAATFPVPVPGPDPAPAAGNSPAVASGLRVLRTLLSVEGWCGMGLPPVIAQPLGSLCLLALGGRPPALTNLTNLASLATLEGLPAVTTRRAWARVLDLLTA